MKTRILLFVLMLTGVVSYAQQDAQFTQYMYNTINVNPGYAGSRGVMSIFGLHRTQWVGLDGAPTTNAFSLNTPINNSNVGIGVSFINDKIGPTNENNISVDVSYTVPMNEEYKLSFGLKASGNLFNLNSADLNPQDPGDDHLQDVSNKFTPGIGAGVYLHGGNFYAGVSVPNFIRTENYNDNDYSVRQREINYYFITGYVFDITPDLKFKPALLSKVVAGAPLQVDVSGNFLLYEKLTLGVAYRWSAAVSAMAGFQITDGLFIGYGYDHETTNLRRYNSGSHEIFLRFELFRNHDRITTPRFF
ncbi:Type IX secretion system membrane protein, PorP/SprF family [Flavobacterium longum]|uniref:PorP/SprF family type IX secretion system membrane protein n=1 Tax=Flavobacterium longum TaxID=1299340 RepID=UPI0039EB4E30